MISKTFNPKTRPEEISVAISRKYENRQKKEFRKRLLEINDDISDFRVICLKGVSVKCVKIVVSRSVVFMDAIKNGKSSLRCHYPEQIVRKVLTWMYGIIPQNMNISQFHFVCEIARKWILRDLKIFLVSLVQEMSLKDLVSLFFSVEDLNDPNDDITKCCVQRLRRQHLKKDFSIVENMDLIQVFRGRADYTEKVEFLSQLSSYGKKISLDTTNDWVHPLELLHVHLRHLNFDPKFRDHCDYVVVCTRDETEEGYPCFESVLAVRSEYFRQVFFSEFRGVFRKRSEYNILNLETNSEFDIEVIRKHVQFHDTRELITRANLMELVELSKILKIYDLESLRQIVFARLEHKMKTLRNEFTKNLQNSNSCRRFSEVDIEIKMLYTLYRIAVRERRAGLIENSRFVLENHGKVVEFFTREVKKCRESYERKLLDEDEKMNLLELKNKKLQRHNEKLEKKLIYLRIENELLSKEETYFGNVNDSTHYSAYRNKGGSRSGEKFSMSTIEGSELVSGKKYYPIIRKERPDEKRLRRTIQKAEDFSKKRKKGRQNSKKNSQF